MKKKIWCMGCLLLGSYLQADPYAYSYQLIRNEIPQVVTEGTISVANLNLNRQGNSIMARPGEKIFSTINFFCDVDYAEMDVLHQIVIGYDMLGAQKCIFNEHGTRYEEGILSFFLEAPKKEGEYEIQCSLEKAYSPVEALKNWNSNNSKKFTVGKIIVIEN